MWGSPCPVSLRRRHQSGSDGRALRVSLVKFLEVRPNANGTQIQHLELDKSERGRWDQFVSSAVWLFRSGSQDISFLLSFLLATTRKFVGSVLGAAQVLCLEEV